MRECHDPIDDAIDALLDTSTAYWKRRKLLQGMSEEQRDEVLDYAKRFIEEDPKLGHRLIQDVYDVEI